MKEIPLTHGAVALVDDADYEWLTAWTWHVRIYGRVHYAERKIGPGRKRTCVYMHRAILDAPHGMEVDHIDGDGLNNQRANLRLVTHAENAMHQRKRTTGATSQYKGVYRIRQVHGIKWTAMICKDKHTRFLGNFVAEIDAARAYDRAARELFGEYAWLNLPDE